MKNKRTFSEWQKEDDEKITKVQYKNIKTSRRVFHFELCFGICFIIIGIIYQISITQTLDFRAALIILIGLSFLLVPIIVYPIVKKYLGEF